MFLKMRSSLCLAVLGGLLFPVGCGAAPEKFPGSADAPAYTSISDNTAPRPAEAQPASAPSPDGMHSLDSYQSQAGDLNKPYQSFPNQQIQRSNDCYSLEVNMPFIGVAEIDNELKAWSAGLVSTADREFKDACSYGQRNLQLVTDYKVSVTRSGTLGLAFFTSRFTGGAHMINEVRTMNFNTENGRLLAYNDIFANTDGLLEFLSDYAHRALRPMLGLFWEQSGMFVRGLDPMPENFQNFVLNPEGLVLIFPPYQIAPYSEGFQTCLVPLDSLAKFQPRPGVWQ